jgi:hypothetical protein
MTTSTEPAMIHPVVSLIKHVMEQRMKTNPIVNLAKIISIMLVAAQVVVSGE